MQVHEPYSLQLSALQRRVLSDGVFDWCGASHPTEELALALGYVGVGDMLEGCKRLAKSIDGGEPMSGPEWKVAISSAEVFFGSGLLGGADDSELTVGISPQRGVEVVGEVRRIWQQVDLELEPWWRRRGPATRPLQNRDGVFVPETAPEPLPDLERRTVLRAAVRALAHGPADVAPSEEEILRWCARGASALVDAGVLDDIAPWVGTVVQRSEASALARLAQALRPWFEDSANNLTTYELERRFATWPLICGVSAELHAWMLRNG